LCAGGEGKEKLITQPLDRICSHLKPIQKGSMGTENTRDTNQSRKDSEGRTFGNATVQRVV